MYFWRMNLASKGYSVFFEKTSFTCLENFLKQNSFSSIFILCDANTKKYCLPLFTKKNKALQRAKFFVIPAGERHKTLDTVNDCWKFLLQQKADRNSLLICLGGGVVCDLGGFVASTFKRGLDFIHVPTTLLAMADASVGGKTGVDFKGFKNLIGTITQPKGVFINEVFLKTLSERQLKNGFAEIVKAALIGDTRLWKKFLSFEKLPLKNTSDLIQASVQVKNKIVIKDPNEKNIRKALNFGHTAGHAIESYFLTKKNSLLHGEAIAMGMFVELCLGKIFGLTSASFAMEGILFLKDNFAMRKFSANEISIFLDLMQHDKKNKGGELSFALVENPGKPVINVSATAAEVKEAFALYNNLLA